MITTSHFFPVASVRRTVDSLSVVLATLAIVITGAFSTLSAQDYFPENGARTYHNQTVALVGGTIHVNADTRYDNGTLVIREGKVISVGIGVMPPADAVIIQLSGQHIYPSFIDLYSSYGIAKEKKAARPPGPMMKRKADGAFGWNEAIMPEVDAVEHFSHDKAVREQLLKAGYGTVLTHRMDGIMRGTAVMSTLASTSSNESILNERAASFLSFDKGSSQQDYPSSLMGAIALLRQTYLDAQWYAKTPSQSREVTDLSLEAVTENAKLPQIFVTRDKEDIFRANEIAKEFGIKFLFKGNGQEYERASDIAVIGSHLILPLVFPKPYEVNNPLEAMNIPLSTLRDWEQMPANASYLYTIGQDFSFTADGLESPDKIREAVRQTIRNGLTEGVALNALTLAPARALGMENAVGSLRQGMLANFLITSGPIFNEGVEIHENWVAGERHILAPTHSVELAGKYDMNIDGLKRSLTVTPDGTGYKATTRAKSGDTTNVKVDITIQDRSVTLKLDNKKKEKVGVYRLSGTVNSRGNIWDGRGQDPDGRWVIWSAIRRSEDNTPIRTIRPDKADKVSRLSYPNKAYGWSEEPLPKDVVIRNATVWTNTEQGIMEDADVLISGGKVIAVGHNLDLKVVLPKKKRNVTFSTIEAYGKHVTCGIIDEHSHIAIARGVNEGSQASTAEVRIGDVIDPDDIDIYRQLAGGVTSAQLLHGSANPIGGQSALIKLRWGYRADRMKIHGAPGFIKFALGENVKQSNWGDLYRVRFPQSRMGVEQVYYDYFIRAKEYKADLGDKRRDLEMEALAEILDKNRFITCHSYIQSEILMLMDVADSMGFKLNTFTHILEGYKVADRMKEHGAAGSTFSDWWAYKFEVNDAIPFNAALMHEQGVLVGINSDDAEMGRRLNQEAAKTVKYGGMSEEEAWKTVTLNPAKMLHLEDRMGSLAPGMDADVVLWTDNPLSIYTQVEKTFVDGILFYDMNEQVAMHERMAAEKNALIQKMLTEGKNGDTQKYEEEIEKNYHCDDLEEGHAH